MVSRYAGQTVVAIGAHADDIEIGVGGTLAKLSKAGAHCLYVVVCVPSDFERRVQESKKAASILGCEFRLLMDEGPCRVEDLKQYDVVGMMDQVGREFAPALILTHGSADYHNDHLLIHNACRASQRLRYFDLLCYYPPSCRPVPVAFHPNIYVDITDTIDEKMKAIDCNQSQFSCRGLGTDVYSDIARMNGRMVGVEYAEGLQAMRMMLE